MVYLYRDHKGIPFAVIPTPILTHRSKDHSSSVAAAEATFKGAHSMRSGGSCGQGCVE